MFKFIEKQFIKTLLTTNEGLNTKTDWGVVFMGSPDSIVLSKTTHDRVKLLGVPLWLPLARNTQYLPQGVIAYLQYFTKILGDFDAETQNFAKPPTVSFDKFEAMIRGRFHKAINDANRALELAKIQPAEAKIVKEQIEYEQKEFEKSFSIPKNTDITRITNQFITQGYNVAWVQDSAPTIVVHLVRQLYDGVQHMDLAFLIDAKGNAHLQNTTDGHYPLKFIRKVVEEINKRYDTVVVTSKEEEK